MCGISGIFNIDGEAVNPQLLELMNASQRHRGPDGEAHWLHENVGLAHTRLAILDLSSCARQPMESQDGSLVLTYNGEVYNFRELRSELEGLGYRFKSTSDTEVVLNAFHAWGPDCVRRFNGMFAFVICDVRARKFFLARDRYGIKPLYYCRAGGAFLFASEIKAFLQHPSFSVDVNPYALVQYFTFQNIFDDRTLFNSVHLLQPGCHATLDAQGEMKITRYWDFEFTEPSENLPLNDYEDECDRLFQKAVSRQLVSDVPVGAYLSGGMDSAAITAIAAREIPYLTSFTAGFDLSSATGAELSFDERKRAELISYKYKTELYEVVIKSGDMERSLSPLVWHLEDLKVGQCYPNYYVSRLASRFVKVVLAGTGGDEIFAGYPWRYYRTSGNQTFEEYVRDYYAYWQRLVPTDLMGRLFRPHVYEAIGDFSTLDVFRGVIGHDRSDLKGPADFINRSLYFECRTFLPGLLVVEDKVSMAHGLEARVPFLDNELVDFAMRLPVSAKLRTLNKAERVDENLGGAKRDSVTVRTNDGKIILRSVLGRYLGSEYVNGIKQGFSGPDASWFRAETRQYVAETILDPNAKMYHFLRPDTVSELVADHLSEKTNRRLLIWSLLCFEWWCRRFLG